LQHGEDDDEDWGPLFPALRIGRFHYNRHTFPNLVVASFSEFRREDWDISNFRVELKMVDKKWNEVVVPPPFSLALGMENNHDLRQGNFNCKLDHVMFDPAFRFPAFGTPAQFENPHQISDTLLGAPFRACLCEAVKAELNALATATPRVQPS
jgi:hypothetical protein